MRCMYSGMQCAWSNMPTLLQPKLITRFDKFSTFIFESATSFVNINFSWFALTTAFCKTAFWSFIALNLTILLLCSTALVSNLSNIFSTTHRKSNRVHLSDAVISSESELTQPSSSSSLIGGVVLLSDLRSECLLSGIVGWTLPMDCAWFELLSSLIPPMNSNEFKMNSPVNNEFKWIIQNTKFICQKHNKYRIKWTVFFV